MFVGAGIAGKMALGGQPLLLCLLVMIGVGLVGGAINALLVTHQKLVAFIATFATLYIGRGVGRWITQTRAMNLPDSFLTLGVSSDEREHPPRLPSGAALPNIRAMANLRAFLVLGRVSNLPTVWSNCLAGWLLSGGGAWSHFAVLLCAATCLYLGGMYLNDAFDAQFDRRHRPERPIPSGAVRAETVWLLGFALLAVGLAGLSGFGKATLLLTLLLLAAILVYDAVHKLFALSPVLMALCRFFLVLVAASLGRDGVTGLAIWSALVLAAYIVGLSYLARAESTNAALRHWPCLLLAAPLLLAFIVNNGPHWPRALLVGGVCVFWLLRCLRFTLWSPQRNVGRTVSGLLAGIPLLDLLAVWEGGPLVAMVFFALFGLALLFQRFIPAT